MSKTPEELEAEATQKAIERKKLFEEHPEQFVHFSEAAYIILMNGNGVIGTNSIGALQQALGKAQCDIPEYIAYLKLEMAKKKAQEKGIITPKGNGGIMDFVRGKR